MTIKALKIALIAAVLPMAQPVFAQDQLSVLLPPWGTLPKDLTDQFAQSTGVTLDAQTLGWDEIRTKIVTSMVANTAPVLVVVFLNRFPVSGLTAGATK